ncbi:TFAM factor, partial [Alcedo cyanopectus]|nr:TFAM factor [Ceyx cyanopectus]
GVGADERPRRPLSAYIRFVKENHSAFKLKNPEKKSRELVKKMAGAWRELPASQKQVYEDAAKTDMQRYREQMAAYKAQLTPAQAAALEDFRRTRLAKIRSSRMKRELTVLGKPKRPRNAFNIFVSENFQESEGASPVAKMKLLHDAWKKMSSSQRQPYLQLAEDDKVRYENEMKSWEAKMVELGRQDLVSSPGPRAQTKAAKKPKAARASSQEKKAKLKLKKPEE